MKRKGFTLLELILVIAIIAIISVVFANLIMATVESDKFVSKSLAGQTTLRRAVKILDDNAKMSVKSYIKYKPYKAHDATGNRDDLSDWWEYLIFEEDEKNKTKELVYYRWETTDEHGDLMYDSEGNSIGKRVRDVLFTSDKNFDYDFRFYKPTNGTENISGEDPNENIKNLIGYELKVYKKDNDGKRIPGSEETIRTTIQPLNMSNERFENAIVDYDPGDKDKVNALAFRTGTQNVRKIANPKLHAVELVFDMSSSMYKKLDNSADKFEGGVENDIWTISNKKIRWESYVYYGTTYFQPVEEGDNQPYIMHSNGHKNIDNPVKKLALEDLNGIFKDYFNLPEHQGKDYYGSSGAYWDTKDPDRGYTPGTIWNLKYNDKKNELTVKKDTRIEILRDSVIGFFDYFNDESYGGITTFGTRSEKSDELMNLKNGKSDLKAFISAMLPYPWHEDGGTNIFDGARRSLGRMEQFMEDGEGKNKNYEKSIVILTDGEFFQYPNPSPSKKNYEGLDKDEIGTDTSENINNKTRPKANNYLKTTLKGKYDSFRSKYGDLNVYVIGFSGVEQDKNDCGSIGENLGAKKIDGKYYYDTKDAETLVRAFEQILVSIDPESMWKLQIPK